MTIAYKKGYSNFQAISINSSPLFYLEREKSASEKTDSFVNPRYVKIQFYQNGRSILIVAQKKEVDKKISGEDSEPRR